MVAGTGPPRVGPGSTAAIGLSQQCRQHRDVDPRLRLLDEAWHQRQSLRQMTPGITGLFLESVPVRPWRLRIDVIGRHRRNAAPVVDARTHEVAERRAPTPPVLCLAVVIPGLAGDRLTAKLKATRR